MQAGPSLGRIQQQSSWRACRGSRWRLPLQRMPPVAAPPGTGPARPADAGPRPKRAPNGLRAAKVRSLAAKVSQRGAPGRSRGRH